MNEGRNHNLEEDMTVLSSQKKSRYKSRRELIYNKLLPYKDESESEAKTCFAEIKGNLGRAVMLRELKPGCSFWSIRLYSYINIYGLKFSKEDHIALIKVMYELITISDLEPSLILQFSSVLILLLKKKELISPDELELPWKPLYKLASHVKKESYANMYRHIGMSKHMINILLDLAKVYFPVSATQEILDELTPMLCPHDEPTMKYALDMLNYLLPYRLRPKYHSLGYQLWFEQFMTMWNICHNPQIWENEMMWIISKVAVANMGYIDWEPYIPLMFTRFMRTLNLPVSYKQKRSSKSSKVETTPIATWIIAVLGNNSSAQMYLDKFLKTIETYLHPANHGHWTGNLKDLLSKLPKLFIARLHYERFAKPTWDVGIPKSALLNDDNIDAFVKSIKPVAMACMFHKTGAFDACEALQQLATIRPNLIIPDVLERMYSTLDSLTEPHKLTAVMNCVAAVSRPMVQGSRNINKGYEYTEGPMHVLPLLFSILPGIDPNDIAKCIITFRLICVYAMLVPIVDSSTSSVITDEEERMVCESTSRFEDFVLQFLDRIFLFIDSSSLEFVRLENRAGNGKSMSECVIEAALSSSCMPLLLHTSDKIFECALHKLRVFVTERILETKVAGQLAGILCRVFARVNGHSTLRALVPILSQTIMDIIGETEDVIKDENVDNRLSYVMLLLSAVLDTPGDNLLPHMKTIQKVLDCTLLLKSREGSITACYILKNILHSLSNVTAYKFQSLERDYNDPDYPYTRDWGKPFHVDTINVKWYIPGQEELAMVQEIFSKYLPPQIEKLKKYCENWNSLTREELLTCLYIVYHIIQGCKNVLPVWDEPPLVLFESATEWTSFSPTFGVKGEIRMPDGSNVRSYMTNILSNLQRVILQNTEDDTKSLLVLIQIWETLLFGTVKPCSNFETRSKTLQDSKKFLGDKLVKNKGHVGAFILERVSLQHEQRLQAQRSVPTKTHKLIISQLFILATSRYSDVRTVAQHTIRGAFHHFYHYHKLILPDIVEVLQKDTEEYHDAYKGVLYILHGLPDIVAAHDWKTLRTLWPAIILSKPSEKLSVIKLKGSIVESIHKNFVTVGISTEISDKCLTAASKLWENDPYPTSSHPDANEIENGLKTWKTFGESNLEAYNGLLDELLKAILEKNIHWRHRLIAMYFISILAHPEQMYPPTVVRYYLEALVHDSLDERKLAINTMVLMLKQQKRKHPKVPINIPVEENATNSRTENTDQFWLQNNSWLQYDYETRPLNEKQWNEPRYVHELFVGYYKWPKPLEVSAPSSSQSSLDSNSQALTDHEKEVDHFFGDPQNVEKLVKFLSLEEKKGHDKFSMRRCNLFKGLFRNRGTVHLQNFIPHLQKLVESKQESNQRCAAEMIAGIIRGSKHWPFEITRNMWDALLPVIRIAFSNLTIETFNDWGKCFAIAQRHRDPNRQHWLLECIMEEPRLGESETSFSECGRLYVLECTLDQQWRVAQLLQRLLARLEGRLLTNPFQNVRERLASLLVIIFENDFKFSYLGQSTSRIQVLMNKVMPKLKKLADDSMTIFSKDEQLISYRMNNVKFNSSTTNSAFNDEEREAAIRLLKTMCRWVIRSIYSTRYGIPPVFYELFPIICQLENYETDEELTKTCSTTLAELACALTLPNNMPVVLDKINNTSKISSWWTRATCLEFMQVFVFYNMSIILSNREWIDCVINIVLRLLEDMRLEVREKAGQVLGGLLHCTFIPDQEKLLEQFKTKAKTKLHKKKDDNLDAVRVRHGAVLGLCSFIRAHPYDIPKYVPPIFEHLGNHLNDPQPIPTTIRKTLEDFKRTHYDSWTSLNGSTQHFTQEQLAILQDLSVPPAHYA